MRLGQCWVELHYGVVWGTLSLLLLAVGKLPRNRVKMRHKTVPQCNSTQHGPRPRQHVFDYVWKRRFLPPPFAKKYACTSSVFARPHENAKGNSLTYISFTLFLFSKQIWYIICQIPQGIWHFLHRPSPHYLCSLTRTNNIGPTVQKGCNIW